MLDRARLKLDPYGLFLRESSGEYPQPGESLAGLLHFWKTGQPPLPEPNAYSL